MKTIPPFQHADIEIEFSEGTHNLGKVKNRTLPFGKFIEMLRKPVSDNVTSAQYLKLPKEEQDRRKNPGFWLGGHSKTGQRATRAIVSRTNITLDIDAGTPELLHALKVRRHQALALLFRAPLDAQAHGRIAALPDHDPAR